MDGGQAASSHATNGLGLSTQAQRTTLHLRLGNICNCSSKETRLLARNTPEFRSAICFVLGPMMRWWPTLLTNPYDNNNNNGRSNNEVIAAPPQATQFRYERALPRRRLLG